MSRVKCRAHGKTARLMTSMSFLPSLKDISTNASVSQVSGRSPADVREYRDEQKRVQNGTKPARFTGQLVTLFGSRPISFPRRLNPLHKRLIALQAVGGVHTEGSFHEPKKRSPDLSV